MSSLHLVFRLLFRTQKFLSAARSGDEQPSWLCEYRNRTIQYEVQRCPKNSQLGSAWICLVGHVRVMYMLSADSEMRTRAVTLNCAHAQSPLHWESSHQGKLICMNFIQARSWFNSPSAAWPASAYGCHATSSSRRELPCQMGSSSSHENVAMGSVMCHGENTSKLQTTQASESTSLQCHWCKKMLLGSASIACV